MRKVITYKILKIMNFGMLKNMVENLVSSYKCPFCSATNIGEKNIDIIGAAWNTVNIDMHCPSCKKHFMAKTEIVHMEIGNVSPEKLSDISKALTALKWKMGGNLEIEADMASSKEEAKILDENITSLRSSMKQKDFSASDLFSDNSEEWKK